LVRAQLVVVQVEVRQQTVAAFQVVRVVEPTLTHSTHHLEPAKPVRETLEVKELEVLANLMVVVVVVVQAQPDQT
jgi:hypothetical protein